MVSVPACLLGWQPPYLRPRTVLGNAGEHRIRITAMPPAARLRSAAASVRGTSAWSLGIRVPFHSPAFPSLGMSAWSREITGLFHGARALFHETDVRRNALKHVMLAANTAEHIRKGARAHRRQPFHSPYMGSRLLPLVRR
jgi:hypothetical protein